MSDITITLKRPHALQQKIIDSKAKRLVIRAGRRSGKTTVAAMIAIRHFLAGDRVLYGTPTQEQVDAFWWEVKKALANVIDSGLFYKNETLHLIELPGTKQRIRAKTCWDADTLRGDSAKVLLLDEYQLMNENVWGEVGAPMLLDWDDGKAIFIYTPPSLHSGSKSKARDPQHAKKLFKRVHESNDPRWEAFHFTSHDNPHISHESLGDITEDMSSLAYRQEIMAEDVDEVQGALWSRELIDRMRVSDLPLNGGEERISLARIVVGVDPPGGSTECGIVAAGRGVDGHIYIIRDSSLQASPDRWAQAVIDTFTECEADIIVGEKNFGGDMVESTIKQAAKDAGIEIRYRNVTATRGKAVRAEPIAARSERGMVHLVGSLPHLEDELCMWVPGESKESPNRLDAAVWACTELMPQSSSWRPMRGTEKEMTEEEKRQKAENMFYPV